MSRATQRQNARAVLAGAKQGTAPWPKKGILETNAEVKPETGRVGKECAQNQKRKRPRRLGTESAGGRAT